MRHRRRYKKLRRYSEHRISMLKTLFKNIINSPKLEIVTTTARAKALVNYSSKYITFAKKAAKIKELLNNAPEEEKPKLRTQLVNFSRKIYSVLRDKKMVKALIDLGVVLNSAKKGESGSVGGYFKIYRLGFRRGDAAPVALVKLVS